MTEKEEIRSDAIFNVSCVLRSYLSNKEAWAKVEVRARKKARETTQRTTVYKYSKDAQTKHRLLCQCPLAPRRPSVRKKED